ncbi:hypothetical protein EAF04_001604 [Stromatinia cepivora]|nr:hypothetical protein EAF04_001604 [Stromatinia cepivora]
MVKWSGIQNSLEEAQSDVLLLLDCCSSGTANTGDGYGTTELIAACGFNDVANGVGPHSFTHALTTELRLLSSHPKFTAAVLYNRVLCRIQNWMPAGRELQKAPLHIVLTQNIALPSSIQLSVKPRSIVPTISPIQSTGSASSASLSTNAMADSGERSSPSSISSLLSTEQQFPRILLSVRLKEDLSSDLSTDLFADWLRMMPIVANSVTIEAGFGSFSTLVLVAIQTPMWVCLERHAAISLVGITREKLGINERSITNSLKRKSIENNSYSPLKAKPQRPARSESFENIHQAPEIGHWKIDEEKSLTHGKDNVRLTVCQEMSAEKEELIQDVEMFCRKVESMTGTGKNLHGNWGLQAKDGETRGARRLSRGRNRTSTAPLLPLGMSRTKKDLMNHLKMDAETFALMDKEAERIYKWLTSEKRHLKNYIHKSARYDWNDFLETSKDQAMKAIAKSGSERTAYYWNLGEPLADSPNWIAKWFLCRRFPYRDQRNPYQLGVYGFVKQPESWV